MAKVWVLAESAGGKVSSLSLELLTKARDLGDTVEAVAWGADTAVDRRRPRRARRIDGPRSR